MTKTIDELKFTIRHKERMIKKCETEIEAMKYDLNFITSEFLKGEAKTEIIALKRRIDRLGYDVYKLNKELDEEININ